MIKEIEKSEIYYVTTDDEDYNEYIRYSSSRWMVIIGESEEPVYDCDELEEEFQKIHVQKVQMHNYLLTLKERIDLMKK